MIQQLLNKCIDPSTNNENKQKEALKLLINNVDTSYYKKLKDLISSFILQKYNAIYNQQFMNLSKEDTNSITVLNERYLFSMRKIGTTETSRSLHVDFSPILEKTSGKSANVFPAYNLDKKPHTPSFILPIDITQYQMHEDQYINLHNKKVQQVSQEKNEIFVPKPSKKNSCCCICKVLYEDYLNHISNPKHQAALKSSSFNKDINQLCSIFIESKTKTSEISTDEEDFNQSPRKKRKGTIKEKSKAQKSQQSACSSNQAQKFSICLNKQIVQILA